MPVPVDWNGGGGKTVGSEALRVGDLPPGPDFRFWKGKGNGVKSGVDGEEKTLFADRLVRVEEEGEGVFRAR